MPQSRKRKTAQHHQQSPDQELHPTWSHNMKLSPRWWAPTMVTLMIVGLILVVIYYVSGGKLPIPPIGNWNLAVGLGVAFIGFLMTLRWK